MKGESIFPIQNKVPILKVSINLQPIPINTDSQRGLWGLEGGGDPFPYPPPPQLMLVSPGVGCLQLLVHMLPTFIHTDTLTDIRDKDMNIQKK